MSAADFDLHVEKLGWFRWRWILEGHLIWPGGRTEPHAYEGETFTKRGALTVGLRMGEKLGSTGRFASKPSTLADEAEMLAKALGELPEHQRRDSEALNAEYARRIERRRADS